MTRSTVRRPPPADAVVERRVSRTARSWRRRAVADDGHSRARDTLIVEAAVAELGRSDAEHGLVEKAEADVADPRLVLPVGVVERATLWGAGPRKRRMSDARAAATEVDPCALIQRHLERSWRRFEATAEAFQSSLFEPQSVPL